MAEQKQDVSDERDDVARTDEGSKMEPYRESEDHVPNPFWQNGIVDTSDTAGAAHNQIDSVTSVFDEARRQHTVMAARALDPEDTEIPSSNVILPEGEAAREAAIANITNAAAELDENPVEFGSANKYARDAGEDTTVREDDER